MSGIKNPRVWEKSGVSTPDTLSASRAWEATTNHWSDESRRQADVYVLAFLHHAEKPTIDPLNTDQWRFFVLPTCDLDSRSRGAPRGQPWFLVFRDGTGSVKKPRTKSDPTRRV